MKKLSPEAELYVDAIKGLHKTFTPHTGQITVGKALINDGILEVFVEAGRNWGKTYLVCYLLWRWAILNPGSENYYFAPFMKQAREIIWAPGIIQNFGPREWIHNQNNTEMRIPFTNGSFIKADGSDNVNAYRGVKPKGLIVFDEFKDFREEFYDAFDPNRAAFNAPLVIIGTPPDRECQFTRVRDAFKIHPEKRYFHAPTHQNPHISSKWLEDKRHELESRNEDDVWQREYMALQVAGGRSKIFPMVTKDVIHPHESIVVRMKRNIKRLEWMYFCDPASASVFGVLFVAMNPYTKEIFVLDEIYEDDQGLMTVSQMGQRILAKKQELTDRYEWRGGYDEAATWFANEMMDSFSEYLEPSMKSANKKEAGLSLIKDLIIHGKVYISERCSKLFWELDNYYKDKNGNIPKKDDHLIDCLRYLLAALHYALPEESPPPPSTKENRDKLNIQGINFK